VDPDFASVARRLNVASRIIAAESALEVGDTGEAHAILVDLETDVVIATEQNEWQDAA
jgi:hypothetical protein